MRNARRTAGAAAILLLAVGFTHGYLTRAAHLFPDAFLRGILPGGLGDKQPTRRSRAQAGKSATPEATAAPAAAAKAEEMRARMDQLMSLGYAAGYEPARDAKGVVAHERSMSAGGYNLLLSGHAPSASLLDMDGRPVLEWMATFEQTWPDVKRGRTPDRRTSYWKRAHLFPNGDLIAMFENYGLVKVDRGSKILWQYKGAVHHDLDVDEQGRIFTLLRRARRIPSVDPDGPTLEDLLLILDPQGRPLDQISILEALEHSPYVNLLRVRAPGGGILHAEGDVLHTNTVTVLDGRQRSRLPGVKKGNVLLALRSLDLVAVLDPEKRALVWGLTGMWVRPHEPVLLDNGHLLIFDNEGWARGGTKLSRALEIDPLTQQTLWSYTGPPDFHSAICGQVQRLANGNTLITVSTEGRVIEVTPAGRVVWEFLNPHATRVDDQERVATIFEMVRLPKSRVAQLVSDTD